MVKVDTLPDGETKGNESDGGNIAQRHEDQLVNHGQHDKIEEYDRSADGLNDQEREFAKESDTAGSLDNTSPVEQRKAIADQEAAGSDRSLYNQSSGKKGRGSQRSRLLAGAKRFGPSGGIAGLVLGTFGLSAIVLTPMSLLVNFADTLSNHTSLGDHLYVKAGNSYMASLLKGEGRDCATSKIKCKFETISEKRMEEWKKRGINVTNAEKTITGRYKIRGLEYKGKEVRTISQYKNLRFTDSEFNSLLKRFPVRAYLLENGPFRKGTLAKFKLSLGQKFTSSKDTDKAKRQAANNTEMNKQTKADVDEKGNIDPKKTEEKGKKDEGKIKSVSEKLKRAKTARQIAGGVTAATALGCMAYDIVRVVQASTVLLWNTELLEFGLPFLQAGAQAKEAGVNGGFDWETAEYFGDRLMQPITQKDINADPEDDITQDMLGKTAMDSKGVDAVINGSYASVNDGYASKYTGWMPADEVLGADIVQDIKGWVGGADNIRSVCTVAKVGTAIASLGACAAKLPQCLATYVAVTAVANMWGDDILEKITEYLQKPALEAIADAGLNSSLHGPPLGQALVSAAGVMAGSMDAASGFTYAGSTSQALQAYNDMYTDPDYIQDEIADGKAKAKENQFDASNKYSFAGQFVSKFASVPWNGTLFSVFANLTSVVSNSQGMLVDSYAQQQGLYQPIEVLNSDQQIKGTINNCTSPGMKDLGAPCLGESGRAIPMMLPTVQNCLNRELVDSNTSCINNAIHYLSQQRYKDSDDKKQPYISEDTGEPTDWSSYKDKENAEEDYKNPMLMFMQYCGRDRVYPLGYTDKSTEEGTDGAGTNNDDWYTGKSCIAGNGSKDETLAWMSYYYTMCIAISASEEGQNYCWDTEASPSEGDSNVCSLLNNPHIHYEQKTTEEDLRKLCSGESVKNFCGQNITLNPVLINAIVSNSSKYDITINNFGFYNDRQINECSSQSWQHPKGNAVDISKIQKIGDATAAGNGSYGSLSYSSSGVQNLVSQYATDFVATLPPNRGGVGQSQCGVHPKYPAGATGPEGYMSFEDSCDHLHIDVRDRTNINGI